MNMLHDYTLFRMHDRCYGRHRVTLSNNNVASRLLSATLIINSNSLVVVRVYRMFSCCLGCPRTSPRESSVERFLWGPVNGFQPDPARKQRPVGRRSVTYPDRMAQDWWPFRSLSHVHICQQLWLMHHFEVKLTPTTSTHSIRVFPLRLGTVFFFGFSGTGHWPPGQPAAGHVGRMGPFASSKWSHGQTFIRPVFF